MNQKPEKLCSGMTFGVRKVGADGFHALFTNKDDAFIWRFSERERDGNRDEWEVIDLATGKVAERRRQWRSFYGIHKPR